MGWWIGLAVIGALSVLFLVDEAVLIPRRERKWRAEERAQDEAMAKALQRYYVSED